MVFITCIHIMSYKSYDFVLNLVEKALIMIYLILQDYLIFIYLNSLFLLALTLEFYTFL